MKLVIRRRFKQCLLMVSAAVVVAAICTAPAMSQIYPVKPVRIVVPYGAGGPTDVIARLVADKMSRSLGQTVVVENKPGAATMIGAETVAKAPGDGYTLLLGTTSTFSTNPHLYKRITYTIDDFRPIALLAKTDWVLTVNNALPVRDIREFVAYAKQHTGQLNYGMMGIGSSSHFVAKMLEGATGIRMMDIPYKGTGPALTDLMGNQIQVYLDAITTSLPLHREGKVRVLGVMGQHRAAIAQDIPTFREAGYPEVVAQSWYGLFAPAETPQFIVERLNRAVIDALRTPEITARFASDGASTEVTTPESFAAMLKEDRDRWGRLIKPFGIRLD